jgi:hypothetical protein
MKGRVTLLKIETETEVTQDTKKIEFDWDNMNLIDNYHSIAAEKVVETLGRDLIQHGYKYSYIYTNTYDMNNKYIYKKIMSQTKGKVTCKAQNECKRYKCSLCDNTQ